MKHCLMLVLALSMILLAGCVVFNAWNADYMVIDLSSGKAPKIGYLDALPEGGWSEEYKTCKLVLRRIEPGTFMMGSPEDEIGRWADKEVQHPVTLTKPYYIGVFEITQKQYELVTGKNPANFSGDMRPVEGISYEDIIGSGGFLEKLKSCCKNISFDLPTDAQWEYACRAGSTNTFYNGRNAVSGERDPALANIARYKWTVNDGKGGGYSEHVDVGSYEPNAWGLYDMLGNVWERCRDWHMNYDSTPQVDPVGPAIGSKHVVRGGCYVYGAGICRPAMRCPADAEANPRDGFRVVVNAER